MALEKVTLRTCDPVDIHVGKRMRQRRVVLGMSQEKLASHLGITFQQIQKNENGLNRMSAGRLYNLSSALGVPIAYFFEEMAPASSKEPPFEDPLHDKETLRLVKLWGCLRHELRPKVMDLIRALVGTEPEPAK